MWVRLIKNNAIYAIGSVANSAALFLLIPFLVNFLPTEEFGAWSIYEVIILMLGILISAGMDIGLMRHYWFLDNDDGRSTLGGTVIIAVITWGVILFFILTLVYWFISRSPWYTQIHLDVFPPFSLFLVYLIGFCETIFSVLLAIFRIREQAIHYVALSVGKMILFLAGAIIGERLIGNINGVLIGRLLAAILGVIGAGIFIFKIIRLKFDFHHLSNVLRYGLPLIPANLSSYILISSDRYILNASSTLTIVAAYSFAYKIASALDVLIIRPFATDWAARRFRIAGEDNSQTKYANIFLVFFFISSLSVSGLIAFTPILYKLIAPDIYLEGIKVLPIILIAIQIFGLSYPLNIGLVIKDKTSTVAKVGIISAIFCIAIELWLIPRFGMIGAAWSTLLSYVLWTVGMTVLSLRVYPIRYNLLKILIIFITMVIGLIGVTLILQSLSNASVEALLISLGWLVFIYGIAGVALVGKFHLKISPKAKSG
ncbi:MAG: polysaccharide biosynthesis C-terminal domain-containing protein [Methanothrix sp.]|nr:polysaccharide biosynthesis C-terminal domain-containing protein [Methanothrix sp.]